MYSDVVDLQEFYDSLLGQTARRVLRAQVRAIWPNLAGERVLALGYAVPLLRGWAQDASTLAAMMPAEQGVAYWPREGPNISTLVDPANLPLADQSVDRVIVMHGLEGASAPQALLREIWRVMRGQGRLLMIVTNRRGLWARKDGTPFGIGRPYSSFQIKDFLREQGFLAERVWQALYVPPTTSRLVLSMADGFERYGRACFPGFGGALMLEAGKQIFAPTRRSFSSRKLVVSLPALEPASS
ncbi:MAG: methyltransferase domain-containing protein [Bdellovibrionales bacterium]